MDINTGFDKRSMAVPGSNPGNHREKKPDKSRSIVASWAHRWQLQRIAADSKTVAFYVMLNIEELPRVAE